MTWSFLVLHVLTEAPAMLSVIFILAAVNLWLNYGRFVPVVCQTLRRELRLSVCCW